MLIGFDTATARVTVALYDEGRVLASFDVDEPMRLIVAANYSEADELQKVA